jgi:hypothetical protein
LRFPTSASISLIFFCSDWYSFRLWFHAILNFISGATQRIAISYQR